MIKSLLAVLILGTTIINSYRFSAGGGAAIAYHNKSNEQLAPSGATSETTTHTINSQLSNGYIIVAIGLWDANSKTVTGVTFDGSAMTELGTVARSAFGGNYRSYLFGLAVGSKAANTYNVIASFSGGGELDEYSVAIVSYNNVHQTTSVGTGATANNSGTTPSVAVSSATGELVVDCVTFGGTPSSAGSGQTSRHMDSTSTGVGTSEEAGASSVTMSWTQASAHWTIVAIPLKPAP